MASIAHADPRVNRCTEQRSIPEKTAGTWAMLAAANARLMARRAQLAEKKPAETKRDTHTPSAEFPPHLGWGGAAPIVHSAPSHGHTSLEVLHASLTSPAQAECPERQLDAAKVVVRPSLLAAMLKGEVVSIGRIYLLCRHIDQAGRGWLVIDDLRDQLTRKDSPLRVCGWRRLRQILQAGKGTFWERDDHGRLWLNGLTRVAAQLAVQRFSGDAVELPLDILLSSIGTVRGAFYATFHSGRDSTPIARATLRDITGVAERTQRNYDIQHDVAISANFTLIQGEENHDLYFEKGRAAFRFTDKLGKHGTAGQCYTAVRLPNSYKISRYTRLSDKRKRLNKRLRQDLVKYGTQGNSSNLRGKVYFSDGRKMVQDKSKNNKFLADCEINYSCFWICVTF